MKNNYEYRPKEKYRDVRQQLNYELLGDLRCAALILAMLLLLLGWAFCHGINTINSYQ